MSKLEHIDENETFSAMMARLKAKHLPEDKRSNQEIMAELDEVGRQEAIKQQERYAIERVEWQKQQAVKRASASGIPTEYQSAELNAYCEYQREISERMTKFVANFELALSTGANAILHGDIGTGKTHFACAVANELLKRGFSVQYTTLYRACAYIKEAWKSQEPDDTETKRIEHFIKSDLLIVDEIRVHRDFDMPIITELFDGRYRERKPTIVITNFNPQQLAECLTLPIYDRLTRKPSAMIELVGDSLRGDIDVF